MPRFPAEDPVEPALHARRRRIGGAVRDLHRLEGTRVSLLLNTDLLEHRVGVGISRRALVAVGDLDLLGRLHPLNHHLHRSQPRLQPLQWRQLDG